MAADGVTPSQLPQSPTLALYRQLGDWHQFGFCQFFFFFNAWSSRKIRNVVRARGPNSDQKFAEEGNPLNLTLQCHHQTGCAVRKGNDVTPSHTNTFLFFFLSFCCCRCFMLLIIEPLSFASEHLEHFQRRRHSHYLVTVQNSSAVRPSALDYHLYLLHLD